jgi:hypothetical protein
VVGGGKGSFRDWERTATRGRIMRQRYYEGIEVDIFDKIIESGENKVAGKFLTG